MKSVHVPARYRTRLAVVYVRQSTERQVRNNDGSRRYQEAQREHARAYGWAADKIVLMNDDLGASGTSVDRRDYQRLLAMIRAGQVGCLFIAEMSRGGRNAIAWFQLLALLAEKDVLLCVDGRMTDPHDPGQVFVRQIEAVVAARDNEMRRDTVHRGKLARVHDGRAVTWPPVGYLPVIDDVGGNLIRTGKWIKDPDPQIQNAIDAIFRFFDCERSLARTCRALKEAGILIPGRRGRRIDWSAPVASRIYTIVTNPAYAGMYVFGRRHQLRAAREEEDWTAERLVGQFVELPRHHEGYITPEAFAENRRLLKLRANTRRHSHLGNGSALLPGLVRCEVHQYRMSVAYPARAPRGIPPHQYRCMGDYLKGGRPCINVPGILLDTTIIPSVLAQLASLPLVREARQLWRERKNASQRETGRRGHGLQAARKNADRAKALLLQCDPCNHEARAMLEGEFERQAREMKRLEDFAANADRDTNDPFTEECWNHVEQLCADVVAIWNAPTTGAQSKKEILRTVLESIIIEGRDRERVRGRLVWQDGSDGAPFELWLPAYYHRLMEEWAAAGCAPAEIVRRLNERGGRTKQGNLWSVATVVRTLGILRARRARSDPPSNQARA